MIDKTSYINIYKLPYAVISTYKYNSVYLYNANIFIIITFNKNIKIFFNEDFFLIKKNLFAFNKHLQNFIAQFFFYKNLKIKFLGKGFKIKKKQKKSVFFVFNRSHITTLWFNQLLNYKLKKRKVYINFINKNNNIVNLLKKIRYISTYTKRGLRLSRQINYKRKGKKT